MLKVCCSAGAVGGTFRPRRHSSWPVLALWDRFERYENTLLHQVVKLLAAIESLVNVLLDLLFHRIQLRLYLRQFVNLRTSE